MNGSAGSGRLGKKINIANGSKGEDIVVRHDCSCYVEEEKETKQMMMMINFDDDDDDSADILLILVCQCLFQTKNWISSFGFL